MKVIIWTNENGNVSVGTPAGDEPIEDIKAAHTPSHSIIVDHDSLPNADGDFFDAWELADGTVSVNFTKAQNITKARLRAERTPLLAAADVAFQRALESNGDTTAIVAEKNRLRDITKLADAAATLAELRALHP